MVNVTNGHQCPESAGNYHFFAAINMIHSQTINVVFWNNAISSLIIIGILTHSQSVMDFCLAKSELCGSIGDNRCASVTDSFICCHISVHS